MGTARSTERTGLVFHDRYLQHNTGLAQVGSPLRPHPFAEPEPHVSSPRTVGRSKQLIDLSGLGEQLAMLPARYATEDELRYVHSADYVAHVRAVAADGGGDAGVGAPLGPDGYDIARLAAGGAIAAVDGVLTGAVQSAYALVRPPGHHATPEAGMGFCIFNNIAIAARHAQRQYGLKRIVIFDWDVHHGNGTQDCFYDDAEILFISFHQEGLFPVESGLVEQVGTGGGRGMTVNVPLPPGCGDATYAAAIERIVVPIVRQFAPELIMVSSGLDASAYDPLGRMNLSSAAYREMTEACEVLADACCAGRLVIVHEGGYSQTYVPACTLAVVEALADVATPWHDPALPRLLRARTRNEVGLDAERAIRNAIATQREFWRL